ncbi:MAG: ATP-binding protein [Treponema sp.]|nr:ATP-binding protein [Treponema sp.]
MPIGIQTFEEIRSNGNVYVDKTAYIYRLVNDSKCYFLGRPRRFGKSLLLSTLKAYFEGQKALFDGLAIAGMEKDWIPYPVFHLDLNAGNYGTVTGLPVKLDDSLRYLEMEWGEDQREKEAPSRFEGLIRRACKKTGKKVVVLVDEYDKPLLQSMENSQVNEDIRSELKAFYGVLKSADPYLRFVFLTGVTKFSKISVFSDLNQPRDISLLDDYAEICGITSAELVENFDPELHALAEKHGLSYEEALAQMKKNFNGYHFSENSEGVFNPFSVLNTLANRKFSYYWFATGTPTFLVRELKNVDFDIREFHDGIVTEVQAIDDYRPGSGNPVALLYQSGYLTITGVDVDTGMYTLGFPNEEVKYGFLKELLPLYIPMVKPGEGFYIGKFYKYLRSCNIDGFMTQFKAFFASIPYDLNYEKTEIHYHKIFYLVFTLLGQFAESEVHSAKGRADAIVKTVDAIYVFEFKLSGSGSVNGALHQIDEKGYFMPYTSDGRKLIKVGVVFDTVERNIEAWKSVVI